MNHYDVIIIGAGPAGMSAAGILKDEKSVLIVDEYYHYGGRLLGQLYEESKDSWWNGMDVARRLHDQLDDKITLQLETSVYNTDNEDEIFTVYTNKGNFTSDYLIVATGAKENSYPLPGWELPGGMTGGAAPWRPDVLRSDAAARGLRHVRRHAPILSPGGHCRE